MKLGTFRKYQKNPEAASEDVQLIAELEPVKEYVLDKKSLQQILRAYEFAKERHIEQKRESGEPYLNHLIAVAQILIEFRLDPNSICAAILHDVIEDTKTTQKEINDQFNQQIVDLVDGMTKLPKQEFVSGDKHQAENYRKMIFASARDLRLVFIKLADRLHNMRTLEYCSREKQVRVAKETLEIYAPLANRLGIARMKWELEDLSFRYLHPEPYDKIRKQMARKRREREKYVELCRSTIKKELEQAEIEAEIKGRPKHFYSIYQKMERQRISFHNVFDLAAVRIICKEYEVKNCYHALGIIHTLWPPIQDRFKDHIAILKSNMYRSIHTTVIGPRGHPLEIQIRTREMDRIAEVGIAAHWNYKEGGKSGHKDQEQFNWLHQLIDWMKELDDPSDFLENFKIDLFPNEIYVFTPAGEVKFLPRGASPVDFAYSIHSDVGQHCVGTRVNDKIVPLHYELTSGDRVEIQTSKKQSPSPDWLKFVKTSRARSKIKKEIRERHRRESITLGKDILKQEFKRYKKSLNRFLKTNGPDLVEAAKNTGIKDLDDLFANVGVGRINGNQFARKLFQENLQDTPEEESDLETQFGKVVKKAFGLENALKVSGIDNMLITYAKCCNPVPGDEIVGFITRGRGLSIHTRDCPNIGSLEAEKSRFIDVSWNFTKKAAFTVYIRIDGKDRKGLFADTASTISKMNSNILSGQIEAQSGNQGARGTFLLEVKDKQHINKIITALHKVKGITRVLRLRSSKD